MNRIKIKLSLTKNLAHINQYLTSQYSIYNNLSEKILILQSKTFKNERLLSWHRIKPRKNVFNIESIYLGVKRKLITRSASSKKV